MTVRFYIIPIEAIDRKYGPEYFNWKYDQNHIIELENVVYSLKIFGGTDVGLIAADVSTAQHTYLTSQADVIAIPVNLDNTVGTNLTAITNALESVNIPAGWVNSNQTYREILKILCGMFFYLQTVSNPQNILENGYTLNTILSDFTPAFRTLAQNTANSFGYDLSSITLSNTWSEVLNIIYAQSNDINKVFEYLGAIEEQIDQNIYNSNITLSDQYSSIPKLWANSLRYSAELLGYDTSGLTVSSTIRDILKNFADEWQKPVIFGSLITL